MNVFVGIYSCIWLHLYSLGSTQTKPGSSDTIKTKSTFSTQIFHPLCTYVSSPAWASYILYPDFNTMCWPLPARIPFLTWLDLNTPPQMAPHRTSVLPCSISNTLYQAAPPPCVGCTQTLNSHVGCQFLLYPSMVSGNLHCVLSPPFPAFY